MIHYLLLYQFPFLYCITIALGLVVYGSDFDEAAGNIYLIPLFLLPLMHWLIAKWFKPVASVALATVVLLVGAVVALLAYKQLHFAFWDEHSLMQAVALSLLGVLSYLASVIASMRLRVWQGDHQRASAVAWLVLGLSWMVAFYYPMSSLFTMAVILAVASVWSVAGPVNLHSLNRVKMPTTRLLKYLLFLLMMDLSLVAWDYQVNTVWAWHLSAAMITAAFGCWLAVKSPKKNLHVVIVIALINFIVAVIWPAFILHFLHSGLVGLCLGWCVGYLVNAEEAKQHLAVVSAALPVFLGMAVGYAIYANLVYAFWRFVFLLPLLLMWFAARPKTASSSAAIS
ncbi:hypothetical protein [Kaarinaea lacus]